MGIRKRILCEKKVNTKLSGGCRNSAVFGIRHFYREYLNSLGLINKKGNILKSQKDKARSYEEFREIFKTINELITDKVVNEALIFKMPLTMGYIFIKKPKITPFSLENIYDRTGIFFPSAVKDSRYKLKIYWKKNDCKKTAFYEAQMYKYRPCQKFKNKLFIQANKDFGTNIYNSIY